MRLKIFGALTRLFAAEPAYAHCDIPCGIYDPHAAQVAAQTVIRMNQLIQGLTLPDPTANKTAVDTYVNSMSRYIATKEHHAELVKKEVLILWGDYFRPEHLEKFPDLHATVWNTVKLAGRNKQTVDMQAAQDLLAGVQRIAEIFWATKGVSVRRQPSLQNVGGETVYPVAE
ncbi:MAG: superoxide dismutase, Ni [Chloroflexi bacterium]|nr:superoxide dismutase, Ni [Chloroflexota bacterium]